MKFAHQSATIRQHGKGMIILETALETAGLTYVFPDGNGIKNIAFQVKRGEIYALYGGHHAGKSVLLQTIIGTLRLQAGTLKLIVFSVRSRVRMLCFPTGLTDCF